MDQNGSTSVATAALHEHAANAAHQREQLTGSVRELLQAEEQVVEELTELLREAKSRRDHLHKALAHLVGESPAKPQAKPTAEQVQWAVTDKTVEKVLAGFQGRASRSPRPSWPPRSAWARPCQGHHRAQEREQLRICGTIAAAARPTK